MVFLEGAWGISLECHQFHRLFIILVSLLTVVHHKVTLFQGGLLSLDLSRAWSLASTCHSFFSSHRSLGVNWFSKLSTVVLAFFDGWYLRPERPWIAVDAFGQCILIRDFTIDQIPWGVTSQFACCFLPLKYPSLSHLSGGFCDPVHCWISSFMPQYSQPVLVL